MTNWLFVVSLNSLVNSFQFISAPALPSVRDQWQSRSHGSQSRGTDQVSGATTLIQPFLPLGVSSFSILHFAFCIQYFAFDSREAELAHCPLPTSECLRNAFMPDSKPLVAILGAGINGCAVARELAINGIGVWLIDSTDIGCGATSRSSRLIHGGLRYLEYRDIALVRESLQERERLLQTAPQFVTPLRLRIPVQRRLGGLVSAGFKFLRLARWLPYSGKMSPRGLWAVRFGLQLYDWLAGATSLPPHRIRRMHSGWICEFSDCQMPYPERFVLALLADAKQAATAQSRTFEVRTYCEAKLTDGRLHLSSLQHGDEVLEPNLIINATGAWGDRTLQSLGIADSNLFAGTKGSHLFTSCERLRQALESGGIYAEAADGRLVFILPCGDGVLIGTTDEPFVADPADAVATEVEIAYLLSLVNEVLPDVRLTRDEIELHHAGVRPLPNVLSNVSSASTAAIPRGHSIVVTKCQNRLVLTLVGGKLTTCRALAEQVTELAMQFIRECEAPAWEGEAPAEPRASQSPIAIPARHAPRSPSSAQRPVPGADAFPTSPEALASFFAETSQRFGLTVSQVAELWPLVGNRFAEIFGGQTDANSVAFRSAKERSFAERKTTLPGTDIPLTFVRWSIQHEWATTLADLVERRLMLVFKSPLSGQTLRALAEELVASGLLAESAINAAVEAESERLARVYGKRIESDAV